LTPDLDWRNPEAVYPYTDEDGALLFHVRRYRDADGAKVVIPFTPDSKAGAPEERVLYRLPEVRRQARAGGVCVLTEGEKDADNVASLGMCATTPPFSSWRPSYCTSLRGATVVIIADRDDAGYAKARARRDCLLRCGVTVAAVLHTPLGHKGADISDHLAAGLGWAGLEPVPPLILAGLRFDEHGRWDGWGSWRFPPTERDGALPTPEPEFLAVWAAGTVRPLDNAP
jgi:hypothetical protein